MITTNLELTNLDGAEHIELDLEDLFVDDVDMDEVEPPTERVVGRDPSLKVWAIAGLVVGLASMTVAALLLAPARRTLRFSFR